MNDSLPAESMPTSQSVDRTELRDVDHRLNLVVSHTTTVPLDERETVCTATGRFRQVDDTLPCGVKGA